MADDVGSIEINVTAEQIVFHICIKEIVAHMGKYKIVRLYIPKDFQNHGYAAVYQIR